MDEKNKVYQMKISLCPENWQPDNEKQIKNLIKASRKEAEKYKEKAEFWNSRYFCLDFDKFIDFIVFKKKPKI